MDLKNLIYCAFIVKCKKCSHLVQLVILEDQFYALSTADKHN